jgi:phosphate-selective porin OprO/OprP
MLIANEQDLMLEPRAVNRVEGRIVDRTQIDAANFGAERCASVDDVNAGTYRHQLREDNRFPRFRSVLLAISALLSVASTTHAQNTPVIAGWDDGFFVQSADGDYRLNLGTVVQTDGRFSLDDPPPITNTFAVRKARVVVAGRASKVFDYRFMPDFGNGSPLILDAYLDLKFSNRLRVRAGKDKTPVGYELLIGDTSLLFPERSLASSLVPNRDVGFQAQGDLATGRLSYAGGVFSGVPDGVNSSGDLDSNNAKDVAGRIALRLRDGLGVHLGGSHGFESGPVPSFKTSIGQTWFAYEPSVIAAGQRNRTTPALFYYHGRVGGFAELVRSTQAVTYAARRASVRNRAWDVTASYVVTGDTTSDRGVHPLNAFDPGARKWGALQLVARYSVLTVDRRVFDEGFAAHQASGGAHQYTVGVNWYPAWVVKYYVNFERTTFEEGYPAEALRRAENVVFVRAQLAF